MFIDPERCINCGGCLPYCPMEAIVISEVLGSVVIDQDECVECGVCRRSAVCPTEAFCRPELEWPRSLRAAFSDQSFRLPGQGNRFSNAMKIGDVTGKYQRGYAYLLIELGRPGTGARFGDLQAVTTAMVAAGYPPEVTRSSGLIIADYATGKLKEEILEEKASRLSMEFPVPLADVPRVWEMLQGVAAGLDTVISVGAMWRINADGSLPELGVGAYPNGKINVGLGRPRAADQPGREEA